MSDRRSDFYPSGRRRSDRRKGFHLRAHVNAIRKFSDDNKGHESFVNELLLWMVKNYNEAIK